MPQFLSTASAEVAGSGHEPVGQPCWIADRGEFIDALGRLRRGEVLVHADDENDERCLLDGQVLYTCWRPLSRFGLLDELPRHPRDGRMHCYRLSPRGRDFADRSIAAWKARPLWQRLAMRLGA
jgi:hypothetical protein